MRSMLMSVGALLSALLCALWACSPAQDAQAMSPPEEELARAKVGWVVDGPHASALIKHGALVWDVRSKAAFMMGHVKGAQHVTWQEFSPAQGDQRGELLSDPKLLGQRLRAKGASTQRVILVLGDPKGGWGEEGRLVWMLRELGHERAALIDGGMDALKGLGVELARGGASPAAPGDMRPKASGRYSISQAQLRAALARPDQLVLLDTRERREYQGKTPYGESRGGHLPGALHLHYRDFLGQDGKLLPEAALRAKLQAAGVKPSSSIVAYCTGGIRSGFVVAALQQLGYAQARNYAGSMWQWSAGDPELYPLTSP